MGIEHLQDISKRPDFKEITARGGRATSERKHKALIHTASIRTKCRTCKIQCEFREMCLKRDSGAICLVPNLLTNAKLNDTKVVKLDDTSLEMYMGELIELYKMYCINADSNETEPKNIERERMRRLNTMFKRLKEFKELWSPPVQKSLNVNIETNFDKMKERFEQYKDELVVEVEGRDS